MRTSASGDFERLSFAPHPIHRWMSCRIASLLLLDSQDTSSFPYRFLDRGFLDRGSKGILISSEAARRMFFYIQFMQQAETFRRYNNVYRFEAMQLRAGHPDKKRRKCNVVQLLQSTKDIISLALQTLIIVIKDWAFCTMSEGTGSYQRSAYIPDQTRLTVSSSPVKYLLARNFKRLQNTRAGETDEILKTLMRDLNSFLSQHTPWHGPYPRRYHRQEHGHSNTGNSTATVPICC